MKTIKVADAIGPVLDWMVAKCEGMTDYEAPALFFYRPDWSPSTDWAQGGPIIERERISVVPLHHDWEATLDLDEGDVMVQTSIGPSPLIAAMRCYVSTTLGVEVEVPEELVP